MRLIEIFRTIVKAARHPSRVLEALAAVDVLAAAQRLEDERALHSVSHAAYARALVEEVGFLRDVNASLHALLAAAVHQPVTLAPAVAAPKKPATMAPARRKARAAEVAAAIAVWCPQCGTEPGARCETRGGAHPDRFARSRDAAVFLAGDT